MLLWNVSHVLERREMNEKKKETYLMGAIAGWANRNVGRIVDLEKSK
jgi:hypothetical protein